MHKAMSMQASANYESQKNIKAIAITALVHAALLLILFLIPIALTTIGKKDLVEEGIEVNLGNSDIGFGDVQPQIPDEPAPDIQPESAPPKEQIATPVEEPEKEVSERDDADAPEVNKPEKKITPVKTIPTNNPPVVKTNPSPKTVVNPTPAPPKPKAVYKGGTGRGGNNSDTYNNSRNQGTAGGNGDQGKPNGNPNSDRYDGNGGSGNTGGRPRVIGNRKIVKYYSFEGDLEKATIFAIVKVSPDGKGTFAAFGPGSTTQGAAYKNAIINYLRNIQFDKSSEESTVKVQFNFKVND